MPKLTNHPNQIRRNRDICLAFERKYNERTKGGKRKYPILVVYEMLSWDFYLTENSISMIVRDTDRWIAMYDALDDKYKRK